MTDRMTDQLRATVAKTLARALTTLEAKVDPAHAALLVVDMQNDFCADGGMLDREGLDVSAAQAIVPRLSGLIDAARAAGCLVVWLQTWYTSEAGYLSDAWLEQSRRRWKGRFIDYPGCLEGGWGAEFYGGLAPLPGEPVVRKHRYGGFTGTDLDMVLRANGVRAVMVTGTATNVCVESTAREAFFHDYYVVMVDDCAAAASEELHAATRTNIDKWFGVVATAGEVMSCWPPARAAVAE